VAEPILVAEAVAKRFGGVQALKDVGLELRQGEILGLIGPNGSGKSTTVNCISGTVLPDTGRIWLSGSEVTRTPAAKRARAGIGRTFQNLRLFRDLTVAENVEVGFRPRYGTLTWSGRKRQRGTRALLSEFGLLNYASRVAGTLAYGLQRRLELARAVAGRPRVLLVDEPAAGLNEVETAELARLLRWSLEEVGCGIILIDHDVSFIMGISDQVEVLHEGSVIFVGKPDLARRDPAVIEAYLGTS
jgi:ABC-type branched-subunit amino acid transport system ATPase component